MEHSLRPPCLFCFCLCQGLVLSRSSSVSFRKGFAWGAPGASAGRGISPAVSRGRPGLVGRAPGPGCFKFMIGVECSLLGQLELVFQPGVTYEVGRLELILRASSMRSLHPLLAKGDAGSNCVPYTNVGHVRGSGPQPSPCMGSSPACHGGFESPTLPLPMPVSHPSLPRPYLLYSRRCYFWQGLRSTVGDGVGGKGLESTGIRTLQSGPSKLKRWVS
jgi:hypothetical protein